jgi:uncharacterized protein (TIGR02270 family)
VADPPIPIGRTTVASAIQAVIDRHAEDGVFLWLWRTHQVRAPNVRLMNLSQRDEQLDAHLDALRVAGPAGIRTAEHGETQFRPGSLFVVVWLALLTCNPEHLRRVVGDVGVLVSGPAGDHDLVASVAATISALAWADRDPAVVAIDHMRIATDPLLRTIAVAAIGARRSDPGPALTPVLSDHSPLVRARTYRATGQLGRADLMAQLRPGLTDPDPECRFWSAWAAARMGATEPLDTLADIAWNNLPRADRALDLLLRRLDVPQANAWLREFAKLPDRQRSLIRATGVIGDPLYIPWLIERMADPATARLAGESFCMITGLDLAYRDLDRRPPADFQSGPNDDPADENVALDEDENLPWPDPERIGQWWTANRSRFSVGTPYFLGAPKATADWLEALSDAFQRQRHAAALELAIRQPDKAMFEVRARGRLQRQLLARARGPA